MNIEAVPSRAHSTHTALLRTVNHLVGEHGIRRLPFGNVVVTSPDIAKEILEGDAVGTLSKSTTVNDVIENVVGPESILSTQSSTAPDRALAMREAMIHFFREKGQVYLESIYEDGTGLCQKIVQEKGIRDIYTHVHGVFVTALLKAFGSVDGIDIQQLQKEILTVSAEVGIKTAIGMRVGEPIVRTMYGSVLYRRNQISTWIQNVTDANQGLWDRNIQGVGSREEMEANMMTLLGAGTTSPAAVICWSLFDAAHNESDRNIITNAENKRELTKLMAKSMSIHPFGFVINRKAAETYSVGTFEIHEGDTIWFLTIPKEASEEDITRMFGIGFGSGARDCIGKHIAIGSYITFMKVWGAHIKRWSATNPKSPLYYTTIKPKDMNITIQAI